MSDLLGFELHCRHSWDTFSHTALLIITGSVLEQNSSYQWAYCPDGSSDTFTGISVLSQLPLA